MLVLSISFEILSSQLLSTLNLPVALHRATPAPAAVKTSPPDRDIICCNVAISCFNFPVTNQFNVKVYSQEFSSIRPKDFHSFLPITHSTTIVVTAKRAPHNHMMWSCFHILQNPPSKQCLGLWHKIIYSQSTWCNTEIPLEAILKQFCWEGAEQEQKHAEPG